MKDFGVLGISCWSLPRCCVRGNMEGVPIYPLQEPGLQIPNAKSSLEPSKIQTPETSSIEWV